MKLLMLTLPDPASNVALDEALLENAESMDEHAEVLRLWQPSSHFVVIGRSSPIETEVNLDYCQRHSIPVFRRASGGASVVTGPGCLMYSLLLDYRLRPQLRMLEQAHQFVMGGMQRALNRLGVSTEFQGTCDLTIQGRKVSGNALRCKRNWMIYHGTFLCQMDLDVLSHCLGTPQRQPEYRRNRTHREFVTQIPVPMEDLGRAVIQEWECVEALQQWPQRLTEKLVEEKYSQSAWTCKIRHPVRPNASN